MDLLPDTLAATVVAVSSVQFARHGIPETLLTDNGPQFISAEFASFCTALTVEHKTSSPYWPQGNGKAESAVKVAKSLLKKSADSIGFQLALLDYRNTPPQGHTLSPAQRSMGRRTSQMIPAPLASLMPLSSTSSLVQDEILARRQRAAITYDNHHRVQASLPELEAGDYVYVKPPPHRKGHAWSYGQITRLVEPRSCVIRTSSGEVRRNRAQVRMAAPPPPPVTVSTPAITSTSATPVSSQSALPAPAPQFPSAKSATSQFPLATSASSNPAVQPTVSSRCDPPHEAQTHSRCSRRFVHRVTVRRRACRRWLRTRPALAESSSRRRCSTRQTMFDTFLSFSLFCMHSFLQSRFLFSLLPYDT